LIGFDIFDTLFTRPLLDPESIKEIVALKVKPQVGQIYRELRGIAETQARQSKGMDVDINEIYIQFKDISELSNDVVNKLKNLEINLEELLLSPRTEGIVLFQEAIKTQKPVSILSDMFLPKEIIKNLLIQNNIKNWDSLLVSSDIGLRKDTQKLYDYVLTHYGITPDQFVMVGDNERSDIQIPCDMGSSFIHLLKPVELARGLPKFSKIIEQHENNWDIHAELTLGLVIQKNFSRIGYPNSFDISSLIEVDPYNYGYSLIGPLLVSFSNWLVKQSEDHDIDRYYFLSREGKLFKDVFDCWTEDLPHKPDSYYLVLSRRAAGVASIEKFSDILEIAKTTYFPNTIENFLFTRYGIRLDENRWVKIDKKIGWSSQNEISVYDKNIDDLIPILHEVEEDIYSRGQYERLGLLEYLKHLGLQEDENQAVVDVGYGGSVQGYLNSLLGNKVHGFYLLTDDRALRISTKFDVKLSGCFYENVDRKNNLPTMYKLNFDLEKLLSSKEPQIEYYERNNNSEIVGRYHNLEELEINANVIRDEIRKGALDYTVDAIRIREKILPTFNPSIWSSKLLIESLLENPSMNEVEFLSKIVLDDYYCGRGLVT
jgi:predicted HAD superfamily hydrolase